MMSGQSRLPLPPPLPRWQRKKNKNKNDVTLLAQGKPTYFRSSTASTSTSSPRISGQAFRTEALGSCGYVAAAGGGGVDGVAGSPVRALSASLQPSSSISSVSSSSNSSQSKAVTSSHESQRLLLRRQSGDLIPGHPSHSPVQGRNGAENSRSSSSFGQPAQWALNVAPPLSDSVAREAGSPLAPILRSPTKPKRLRPASATLASAAPASPLNGRLAPLALTQIHHEDSNASATGLLQRATPRNIRSLLRNFLLDSSGKLNPHVDMVAHAVDSGAAITNSLLQEVVQFHPSIQSLNLRACNEITDVGLWAIARFCKHLKGLNLSFAESFTHIGLRSLTLRCTEITSLDLSHCPQVTDAAVRVVAGGCGNLEHLNLSYCDNITDLSLSEVAQCCRNLKHLDVTCCSGLSQFGDYALAHCGTHLGQLEELLCIGCPHIRNAGIEGLAEGTCTSTVHTLRFTTCTAGIKGAVPTDALARFTKLQHLQLAGWKRITDADLQVLSTSLPRLRILDISGAQTVSAKGLKSLRSLPKLVDLNLQNCALVGDAKSLEALCLACPQLEALNLAGCRGFVEREAVNSLLAGCTRLATLNVTETREMSLRYMQDLAARLPFSNANILSSKKMQKRKKHRRGQRPRSRGGGLLAGLKQLEEDLIEAEVGAAVSTINPQALVNSNWLDPVFFGLQAVDDYYQCVHEEELRIKGNFAAIRIQSFLRGAAARGGVAALREKYRRIKATAKFQAAFRGLRGRRRAQEMLDLIKKINLSTTLSRVWRGAVVRREVARQRRFLQLARNRYVAASKCQALIRGHIARVFTDQLLRDRALAAQQESLRKFRRERAAVTIQCMYRAHRSRGLHWAALTARREAQMLRKLMLTSATRIQKVVRARIARGVLHRLREKKAHEKFVRALALLQSKVKAWKARAVVQVLREERQWYEYQWYCAQIIQRCWRRARSRFTVQVLRSLAALGREEAKAALIIQRFARLVRGRSIYWAFKRQQAEKRAQDKAQRLLRRVWFGAQGRQTAEVFRALIKARTDAAPIYAAVSELEAQRREVKGKLDVVLKKHGALMKARNNVAAELRAVLKTRQKYYDSHTMQPGVSQRFLVSFLKDELKERLRVAKDDMKPLKPVIDTLDAELKDLDDQLSVLRVKLQPFEDNIKERAIRHRRERIKRGMETQARAATMLQASFRGQRTREALRRSGGINYWILSWDEEEEREAYYNTFTGEKTWYRPVEMELFDVEAKRPNEATKWVEEWDTTAGAFFYYNTRTGEYRWEKPADFDMDLGEEVQGEGLEWFEAKKTSSRRLLAIEDADGTVAPGDGEQPAEQSAGGAANSNSTLEDGQEEEEDYLASQPKTGRSIYAWEELVDEESERTYYMNSETGETRWSLPPRDALSSETGLRATQALVAENPLWQGVAGEGIEVPDNGFVPNTLEDNVHVLPHELDAEGDQEESTALVDYQGYQPGAEAGEADNSSFNSGVLVAGNDEEVLPDGWEEVLDEDSGSTFYYNEGTGESRWERPVIARIRNMAHISAAFSSKHTLESGAKQDSELLDSDVNDVATTEQGNGQLNAGDTSELTTEELIPGGSTEQSHAGMDVTNGNNPSHPEAGTLDQEVDGHSESFPVGAEATNVFASAANTVSDDARKHGEEADDHGNETNDNIVVNEVQESNELVPVLEERNPNASGQELLEAAALWEEVQDAESGLSYFYNNSTGESLWEMPQDMVDAIRTLQTNVGAGGEAAQDVEESSTALVAVEQVQWEALTNGDGVPYYYNSETGETTMTLPAESQTSQAIVPVGGDDVANEAESTAHDDLADEADEVDNWEKVEDDTSGDSYFYNHVTGESRWSLPRHMLLAMSTVNIFGGSISVGAIEGPAVANSGSSAASTSPEDWEVVEEEDGTVYYYNPQTGATTYRDPFSVEDNDTASGADGEFNF